MELDRETPDSEDLLKNMYLAFSLGEENYGISIEYVTEIIGMESITKVPELPDYVEGIINLRGQIITVMDARLRFKKVRKPYDDRTCIVVIHIGETSFGLIVDYVKEVRSLDQTKISPSPVLTMQQDAGGSFVQGVGKVDSDIWLLIDCDKLLDKSILN